MKKRSRSVPEAYRKGRKVHVRVASRREAIRVLESFCVSPNILIQQRPQLLGFLLPSS